jgi:hypothetical protein
VGFLRGIDGSEPVRPEGAGGLAGVEEERRAVRSGRVATGTLACPDCDAPVAPGPVALSPSAPLGCPYCGRSGAVRDFLSLGEPSRPARVAVRVVHRVR